jgi:phosphoserine phosphatase RsbU/P
VCEVSSTDRDYDFTHSIRGFAVTKDVPPFPRLHLAEGFSTPPMLPSVSNSMESMNRAFQTATGWSLCEQQQQRTTGDSPDMPRFMVSATDVGDESAELQPIERHRAAKLADTFSELYDRIDALQSALWRREAELAIGIPVSPRREEESHLAERLEVMLMNGAEATGCQAAGLYMLDDATSLLKLRACWGLTKDRLLDPARPLNDAFADLEALLGHAVVLDDASLLPHWRSPEPFPAAVCLPVMSPTDSLGTIWFFADRVREFSDQEIHLAEIIAGSIASELQREVLLGECLASKNADRQIIDVSRWQQDRLPTIKPMSDDWEVAGWSSDNELTNSFFDWFVPPDGSITVAVGSCGGSQLESALNVAALQSSVRSHGEHAHDASTMMARVNDTMWNASAGGEPASLFYCKTAPDSGEIEYSTAGAIQGILVQQSGIELLYPDSMPLGIDPGLEPERARAILAAGDFLVLLSTTSDRPSLQLELSRQLAKQRAATAEELLSLVRSLHLGTSTALILQRQ